MCRFGIFCPGTFCYLQFSNSGSYSRSLMNIERMLGGCLDPDRMRVLSLNQQITRSILHYVEQC